MSSVTGVLRRRTNGLKNGKPFCESITACIERRCMSSHSNVRG